MVSLVDVPVAVVLRVGGSCRITGWLSSLPLFASWSSLLLQTRFAHHARRSILESTSPAA